MWSADMDVEALIETMAPAVPGPERLVLVGGAKDTLDLLRLATVRSDSVLLLMPCPGEDIIRYARHFGVSVETRPAEAGDLVAAGLAIIATADPRLDMQALRFARRSGVPVHVRGQPQLSDFTLIAMLEWHPSSVRSSPSLMVA
jgi:siroheme synthase (precorrin-2 oxidase/ferrochelatase)